MSTSEYNLELTSKDRATMLDEVAEVLKPLKQPDDWFTCDEMAERWDVTYQEAHYQLDLLVREGTVRKHKVTAKKVFYEMVKEEVRHE